MKKSLLQDMNFIKVHGSTMMKKRKFSSIDQNQDIIFEDFHLEESVEDIEEEYERNENYDCM